jgi:hypothetical protein
MTTIRPAAGSSAPASEAYAITPSNSTDLSVPTRGIYVGVTGDLKVDMVEAGTVTFKGLAAGLIHPISAKRIYATGTTATDILGVY